MNLLRLSWIYICFLQISLFSNDLGRNEATIEVLKGSEVIPYLSKLAELRLSFFRNYPYLYDGNLRDEEEYLTMYARSENSIFGVVKEGEEIIGLVTGLPLLECHDAHKNPWIQREDPNVFYLGEIVLSEKYQTTDLQEKLYQQFEHVVKEIGIYEAIVVCEIERGEENLKKPENEFSSEVLWNGRGFIRHPEIRGHFPWKEIGDLEESDHSMVYWKKPLSF